MGSTSQLSARAEGVAECLAKALTKLDVLMARAAVKTFKWTLAFAPGRTVENPARVSLQIARHYDAHFRSRRMDPELRSSPQTVGPAIGIRVAPGLSPTAPSCTATASPRRYEILDGVVLVESR